ncbi:MAG: hypothetical protein KAT00_03135, partial [Planctomycetes bacterium]|nr:hypothetical protein [Planctomycetota bacterium]
FVHLLHISSTYYACRAKEVMGCSLVWQAVSAGITGIYVKTAILAHRLRIVSVRSATVLTQFKEKTMGQVRIGS